MIPDDSTFQFLAENSVDIIRRVDMDATLRYVSPSCMRILGWVPTEMTGKNMEEFVFPEDLPLFSKAVARANAPGIEEASETLRMLRKGGGTCWMEIYARVVRDSATGDALSAALIMRDVTERKQLEDHLSLLALTDGLTGLGNRRAFDQALDREWRRTLREGSQISLLLLDIDHFKRFNDHYGHQFGDDCLRAVAAAARNAVKRVIDIVARYGGEEIAIILPSTDGNGAIAVAEAVRQAILDLRIPHAGNADVGSIVTASIGVSTALARHGGTMKMPESLLLSADHALYKAKYEGRNRIATNLLMASQDGVSE